MGKKILNVLVAVFTVITSCEKDDLHSQVVQTWLTSSDSNYEMYFVAFNKKSGNIQQNDTASSMMISINKNKRIQKMIGFGYTLTGGICESC